MKKFSIITPCFNAENYIKETFNSIINQTALSSQRIELEYIICDGKSSDTTLKIIDDIINNLENYNVKPNNIKIISEDDSGMYSALAKGLKIVNGDIVSYLNAGDYYHKCAFDIVLDIFEAKNINWLTGYNILYNEKSYLTKVVLPYKYRQHFFNCGLYLKHLPFVQQESTFWHSKLNDFIDYDILSNFKYAGDYYLWSEFAKLEELCIVEAYLGGFKIHKGQLSENIESYYLEAKTLCQNPKIHDLIVAYTDKLMWYMPSKVKKIFNPNNLFQFNHNIQTWV